MSKTQTKTVITCDICKLEIADRTSYVDAGVYGRDFHIGCLESTYASKVLPMLLDDIYVTTSDSPDRGNRYYGDIK